MYYLNEMNNPILDIQKKYEFRGFEFWVVR